MSLGYLIEDGSSGSSTPTDDLLVIYNGDSKLRNGATETHSGNGSVAIGVTNIMVQALCGQGVHQNATQNITFDTKGYDTLTIIVSNAIVGGSGQGVYSENSITVKNGSATLATYSNIGASIRYTVDVSSVSNATVSIYAFGSAYGGGQTNIQVSSIFLE